MAENITQISWENIAESITEGRCILFLGHQATVNYGNPDRLNSFFEDIVNQHKNDVDSFHKGDGLLLFKNDDAIIDISRKVRNFYSTDFTSALTDKLVKIPFHSYLMLSPDSTINAALQKSGFAFQHNYFDKLNLREIENKPTAGIPLVYNLFGSTANANSMIISHGDLYAFMKQFFGGKNFPNTIKTMLNPENTDHIVFLGVDFDKWYFQLILNFLDLDYRRYKRYAMLQENTANNDKVIWEKHFRISFVPNAIDSFVDNIYNIFEKNGKLRKVAENAVAKKVILPNILKLVTSMFDSTALTTFCMCYFPEVHEQFTEEQSKSTRINKLLEHAKQTENYTMLLDQCKDENAVQYERFKPYFE